MLILSYKKFLFSLLHFLFIFYVLSQVLNYDTFIYALLFKIKYRLKKLIFIFLINI